jgi:hypothetical protein
MSPQDAPVTLDELREAAIAADRELSSPGEPVAKTRQHVVIRVARMSFATLLLLAGLAMMVLPGPGLLVIAMGLAILARDVAWAERVLVKVRSRLPADESGAPKRWVVVVSVAGLLVGAAASVLFALR